MKTRNWFILAVVLSALVTGLLAALIMNIFQRKEEAKNPYLKFVNVDNNTTDPAVWGMNWSREYDSYQRTVDVTHTRYGGSEAMPAEKLDRDPWLKRVFSGYAFSIDYRDRRGHAYMLFDQERTERVTKKPQPGACLNCHASVVPTYRRLGLPEGQVSSDFDWPAVIGGFEKLCKMTYADAHAEVIRTETLISGGPALSMAVKAPTTQQTLEAQSQHGTMHPVSCVDCHDPGNMELRVTRPAFVLGIQALAKSDTAVPHLPSIERWRQGDRSAAYDPNRDATRQEMRSFVCGQCHVEYYCGPKVTLFFPWNNGLTADKIESYYDSYKFPDGHRFYDWKHGETGAEVLKAQHPEFETWSQGIHARSGVACADCHMPYKREGALKVSDHWVRSPLLMVNRACQQCHPYPEEELKARVQGIQDRTHGLIERAGQAVVGMLDAIKEARGAGVKEEALAEVFALQRKAQWRLDFVYAENSVGFHAPQETARVLAEAIDYARQGEAAAEKLHLTMPSRPVAVPATEPVEGVTEKGKAPPGPYRQP